MAKKIMIVDTETIGVQKKFCYDIGYVIAEIDEDFCDFIEQKNFLVKQVWRNTMLFSTAYYAEKKPIYTNMLRNKKDYHDICVLRYDEIMDEIQKSIDKHNVEYIYAYNSKFDEEVFNFNCEWFKTNNPFAELPFYDIRAYFMEVVKNSFSFKSYCENYKLFTENGNYSTTAETAFKYIMNREDFIESHTALDDSRIETLILAWCYHYHNGIDIFSELIAPKMLKREVEKTFILNYKNKKYELKGTSATWYKKKNTFVIK